MDAVNLAMWADGTIVWGDPWHPIAIPENDQDRFEAYMKGSVDPQSVVALVRSLKQSSYADALERPCGIGRYYYEVLIYDGENYKRIKVDGAQLDTAQCANEYYLACRSLVLELRSVIPDGGTIEGPQRLAFQYLPLDYPTRYSGVLSAKPDRFYAWAPEPQKSNLEALKLIRPSDISTNPLIILYARKAQDAEYGVRVAYWQDGTLIWSDNEAWMGGPPYWKRHIGAEAVSELLEDLSNIPLLDSPCLSERRAVLENSSQFNHYFTFAIPVKNLFVEIVTSHGIDERSGNWVSTAFGKELRAGRSDDEWLAQEPPCYEFFRRDYSEMEKLILNPVLLDELGGEYLGSVVWH